jgi:D-aspartate ligase
MDDRLRKAFACVMGDMDLVRPLGLAGISCAVVAPPGAPSRYSRFTRRVLDWADAWDRAEELVEILVRFGSAQPEPPVLFYEEDADLLLVSRYRERLARVFRFVIPDATLVEDLVDKFRFHTLADRFALPVPPTQRLYPIEGSTSADLNLRFPLIIKPLTRRPAYWAPLAGSSKAVQVNTPETLRSLWPRLVAAKVDVLAQEMIPGPETCVESYHVYVDVQGDIVGEFTGRKIRTYPEKYGDSTALMITNTADLAELGRELVNRLRLRGVAKFDFKRGPNGKLYLLEINPRFNLWHHPGALAGVNIPALVYCDLVGLPRPTVLDAKPGISWCRIWQDVIAAKAWGVPFVKWLPWALNCEAKRAMAWDDPMAFARAVLFRALFRHHASRAS